MTQPEDIIEQQKLLNIHRQTLTLFLQQEAIHGKANVPSNIYHGIQEARRQIRHIKMVLRRWGVNSEDHPNDEDLSEQSSTHNPTSQHTIMVKSPTVNQDDARKLRIFLCHASGDKPIVRYLCQNLQAAGFAPWLDEEKLLPGQDWQLEIRKAVRETDIVIVCLSHQSTTKAGYVQKEIKYALDVADEQPEGAIFIIPVRLESCDVPERLRLWHWVDIFDNKGFDRLLQSLCHRLEEIKISSSHKASNESKNDQISSIISYITLPNVVYPSSPPITDYKSGPGNLIFTNQSRKFQVMGITSMLPIDIFFALNEEDSSEKLITELRSIRSLTDAKPKSTNVQPLVSGGGKIANILAYLGLSGYSAAICGITGNDNLGDFIVQELNDKYHVNTDFIKRGKFSTRVMFIVYKEGLKRARQIQINKPSLSSYSSYVNKNTPYSDIVVIGRTNKSSLDYIKVNKNRNDQSKVSLHLGYLPYQKSELELLEETIRYSDLLFVQGDTLKQFLSHFKRNDWRELSFLIDSPKNKLIVLYGTENLQCIDNYGRLFEINKPKDTGILDPTGMADCYHAALLEYFIERGWQVDDQDYLKTALDYAYDIALLHGRSFGARSYPSFLDHSLVREQYKLNMRR